ncbi:unnamed protein product [Rotaria sordida]|uniref:Uncharacterized protein n=1 Tax=Rotaria sordida TaxID=392033 RepID=A0A814SXJ9_9BILA|nr:unnamed protein product [Rotaria sordida]CAF1390736.1 unnamed protein product [Rotaria sordida]
MGQIYSNPIQVLAEAQPGDIIQFERGWNQSHCGIYADLPSDEILKRARGYNFGKYYWNSTSNHFAAECRYGQDWNSMYKKYCTSFGF